MSAARPLAKPPDPDSMDHFVHLHGSWEDYERLLAMRRESSVPRITYLEGLIELMSPSKYRELDRKRFARLLEAWDEEAGVDLEGYGSWRRGRLAEEQVHEQGTDERHRQAPEQ